MRNRRRLEGNVSRGARISSARPSDATAGRPRRRARPNVRSVRRRRRNTYRNRRGSPPSRVAVVVLRSRRTAAAAAVAAMTPPVPRAQDEAAGADNVAYFAADGRTATNGNGNGAGRHAAGPDRHQLPPSALTPVQFEMNYGTPVDDGMSSKDNLLMPKGQCDTFIVRVRDTRPPTCGVGL